MELAGFPARPNRRPDPSRLSRPELARRRVASKSAAPRTRPDPPALCRPLLRFQLGRSIEGLGAVEQELLCRHVHSHDFRRGLDLLARLAEKTLDRAVKRRGHSHHLFWFEMHRDLVFFGRPQVQGLPTDDNLPRGRLGRCRIGGVRRPLFVGLGRFATLLRRPLFRGRFSIARGRGGDDTSSPGPRLAIEPKSAARSSSEFLLSVTRP